MRIRIHTKTNVLSANLAPADLQLVVDTRVEVVEDDHLALGPEAGFFLQAHPHQRLDTRRAGDAAHRGRSAPQRLILRR
jgi:hypothetical protein